MATVHNAGMLAIPMKAGEALDDYQYYVCQLTASAPGFVDLAQTACTPHVFGVIQDNNASAASANVMVGVFGPMVAKVAACDNAGNTCPIAAGDYLRVASTGYLVKAGSVGDIPCARALGAIPSSCYIGNIEVFWFGGLPGASATTTT